MNGKHLAGIVVAVCIAVFGLVFYNQLFYTVDATHIAVFQRPVSGTLEVVEAPGTYWRLGSRVTEYRKRDIFRFEYNANRSSDNSIQVRFNDGGHAWVGGNMSWEMPVDPKQVARLHQLFGSQENIDDQLVKQAVSRAMYLTSPLMSSTESYAARRNDFLQIFADQVENGVYQTEAIETRQPDPITGEMKTVRVVKIIHDPKTGMPVRSETSPLKEFGINILPPTINSVVYDPEVEKQIQQQRDNIMQIQTAQAEAKKAEQAAITAEKNGQAAAAQAKWTQEVEKAKQVTLAEQNKEVAELNAKRDLQVQTLRAQTAEQYRVEQTKIGEGDAARRQAVMQADGALQAKLDAWLKSQEMWSAAFAQYKGNVVPQFVTGSSSANGATPASANGALDFMQLMAMKAAKDLALDTSIQTPTRH